MKYLKTRHEKKSAQVTALITLILVLMLFFVTSPPYTDPPEEYGVAINFGNPSQAEDNISENFPSSLDDSNIDDVLESSEPEEIVEEELVEEEVNEELIEEVVDETTEEKTEERLLTQETEDALRAKEAKEEARKQEEAQKKAEAKIAKTKANALARAAADRAAKAAKLAANKKAEGGNSNKIVSFRAVERVPIYPGCENGSNEVRRKCMSDKINAFISNNFNKEMPGDIGLKGIQSININFKIDEEGRVVSINARAADPKLVAEAKRVAKMLPRFKPGIQNGKPVTVPFAVPLKIQTGK